MVAVGTFIAFVRGCDVGSAICADEVVGRYPSSSGACEVIVLVRDCGATTTWATHLIVVERHRLIPDTNTLVFVADGNHGLAPQGPAYGPEVRVQWRDDKTLAVSHHKNARIFRSDFNADEVNIEYALRVVAIRVAADWALAYARTSR